MSQKPIRIRIDGSGSSLPLADPAKNPILYTGEAWVPPTAIDAISRLRDVGIPVFLGPSHILVATETDEEGNYLTLDKWCDKHNVSAAGQSRIAAKCTALLNACRPQFAPYVVLHHQGKLTCTPAGDLMLHVTRDWFNSAVIPKPIIDATADASWSFPTRAVTGYAQFGRFADKLTTLRPDCTIADDIAWEGAASPWVAPGTVAAQGMNILPGPNAGYYTDFYALGALAQSEAWGIAQSILDSFVSIFDGQPYPSAVPATDEATNLDPAAVIPWLAQHIPAWTDDNGLVPTPTTQTGPWRPGLYFDGDGRVILAEARADIHALDNFRPAGLQDYQTKTWPGANGGDAHRAVRIGTLTPSIPADPWQGTTAPRADADPTVRFLTPSAPDPLAYYLYFGEDANLDAATLTVRAFTGIGNNIPAADPYVTVAFFVFGDGFPGLTPLDGAPTPVLGTAMGDNIHVYHIPLAGLIPADDGQHLNNGQSVTLRYGVNHDGAASGFSVCKIALPNVNLRHISAAWGLTPQTQLFDPTIPDFATWQPPDHRDP